MAETRFNRALWSALMPTSLRQKEPVAAAPPDRGRRTLIGVLIVILLGVAFALSLGAVAVVTLFV